MELEPAGPLSGRVARGASMLVLANLAARVIAALGLAALARLLSPDDYGLMAMALVVVGFADMLTNLQFANALIREPALEDSHFDCAFTLTLLRGLLAGAALHLSAEPVAALMGAQELEAPLRWMALIPVLDGLRNPRLAAYARAVDFRPEIATEIGAKLVGAAVSVALAAALGDFRALVGGALAASATAVAISHAAAPARLRLSLRHARAFFSFGGWMTAAGAVNFVNYKSDVMLIGAQLGAPALGRYAMGEQIAAMATHQLAYPLTRAVYPGLAAVVGDAARLRAAHGKAQAVILAALAPIGVGAALAAPEIMRVVAGPQWSDAVPVLQALAPVMAFGMTGAAAQAVAMAAGDTRSIFRVSCVNLAVRLPAVLVGLWAFGLPGVLAARVLSGFAAAVGMLRLATRQTGEPVWAPLRAGWRTLLSCGAMALAVGSAAPTHDGSLGAAAAALAVKVALGASVYGLCHVGLWAATGRPDGAERLAFVAIHRLKEKLTACIRA